MGASALGQMNPTDTGLGKELLQSMPTGSGQVPPNPEQVQQLIANNPAMVNYGGQQTQLPTALQSPSFNFSQQSAPYWGSYNNPTPRPPINSVSDLYTNILRRDPDAEGLAHWQQKFGDTVENSEMQEFIRGAQLNKENINSLYTQPQYSTYVPPSSMPNVNSYLGSPNTLLSSMQSAGLPSSGAGRFSNLLSTNN